MHAPVHAFSHRRLAASLAQCRTPLRPCNTEMELSRYGASQSLHDASFRIPPHSEKSTFLSHSATMAIIGRTSSIQLSFGTSRPAASLGTSKPPYSWCAQELSSYSMARQPLAGTHTTEVKNVAVPCWWASMDSGLLGSFIFLMAMLLYIWAIPLGQSTRQSDYVLQSRLWLVAALLFVLESLIDLLWGLKGWIAEAAAATNKRDLEQIMSRSCASPPSGLTSAEGTVGFCAPWLGEVHYDVWAALFFVIPSLLYTFSSLLDPNVVVWSWLNVLRGFGMTDADYSTLCNQVAACLFVFDSMIGLTGRWSCRRTTPIEEQLTIVQLWNVRGLFEVDWAAWGDFLFFVGSIVGVLQQFATYNVGLDYSTQILWTLDALFYCIGCWPTFVALVREHGDGVAEP